VSRTERSNKMWNLVPIVCLIAGILAIGIGIGLRRSAIAQIKANIDSLGATHDYPDCTDGTHIDTELDTFVNWQIDQYAGLVCTFTSTEEYNRRFEQWVETTPEGEAFKQMQQENNALQNQTGGIIKILEPLGLVLLILGVIIGAWRLIVNRKKPKQAR
jgi:hypothetical protein